MKFVLFEHVEGRRYTASSEQIASSAKTLAELNKCPFIPPQGHVPEDQFTFVRNHIDLLKSVDKDEGEYTEEIKILSTILDKTEADCRASAWDTLSPGIVHGDYSPWNLLYKKDGSVKAVLDFDNCAHGSRLQDLSEALVTFAYIDYKKDSTNFVPITKNTADVTVASDFLKSYTDVAPLSQEETNCLPHLVKATMIEFFCLGLVRKDFGKESWKPFMEALNNVPAQINNLTQPKENQHARKVSGRSFRPS